MRKVHVLTIAIMSFVAPVAGARAALRIPNKVHDARA